MREALGGCVRREVCVGGDGETFGLDALSEHLAFANVDGVFLDEEGVEGGEGR